MHPAFKEFQKTQIGRLKTRTLSDISGSMAEFPSERETISAIMEAWLDNCEWGRFLFHILYCKNCQIVPSVRKISVKQVHRCLELLGRYEPIQKIVAECSSANQDEATSFVILGHTKPDKEPGYYAAIFDSDDYKKINKFLSIVPFGRDAGRIDLMTSQGWARLSSKEAANTPEIATLLQGIWQYLTRPNELEVTFDKLKIDKQWEAPCDEEYFTLVKSAYSGNLLVSRAKVSLDLIQPHDTSFLVSVAEGKLLDAQCRSSVKQPEAMVVYWNGSHFVMSDDYFIYSICLRHDICEVDVAILGEFPESLVKLESRGGVNLLPKLVIDSDDYSESSDEFKKWVVSTRLRRRNSAPVPGTLIATWLVLADILGSKKVKERDVHDFLKKHPEVISVYANSIESEVSLGGKYRIDLIVRESGLGERVTLIELESPSHDLLTIQGRPRYEVTHAIQQVRDWLRWLRENPDHGIATELKGLRPECLVVMGRSKDLNENDLAILQGLNEESFVQLITYDELLSRFRDMILRQCDGRRM